MINSLFKDSHITQSLLHSQISSGSSANNRTRQEYSSATVKNSISLKKPAEVNFRGLPSVTLANSDGLKALISKTKVFLADKSNPKSVKELIKDSISTITGTKTNTSENIENFLGLAREDVKSLINKTELMVKEENKKNPLKPDSFKKEFDMTIQEAIDGVFIIEKTKNSGIYKNGLVKKFLELAAHSETLFNATFSIALACILRPAAIMALPGEKKNNDDKKYAAAHSVASGIISYLVALVALNPIADAMKKVTEDLGKFGIKETSKLSGDKKALDAAGTYIKMIPETILAAPRAMITIALIPPILKYFFGLEKKHSEKGKMSPITQDYSLINKNKQESQNERLANKTEKRVSFGGNLSPKSKIFVHLDNAKDRLTDLIAVPISKFLKLKPVETIIDKTKNSKNLVQHITALTSVVLSGFYMEQTLKNDKLDPQKRKTLAINQGAVTVLSTIMSYTVCKALDKTIKSFSNKFIMLNSQTIDIETLEKKYKKGIKNAASIMIFMTIYRFVAPVLVTPVANYIGNKLQEKKEMEIASK